MPTLKLRQRKSKRSAEEIVQEQLDTGEADPRVYCLAAFRESCLLLSSMKSKSLTLVTDAGEVGGEKIDLYYMFSLEAKQGALLPHQAGN